MYPPDYLTVLVIVVWSLVTAWAWGSDVQTRVNHLRRYRDERSERELRASLAGAFVAATAIACVVGVLGTGSALFIALPLGAVGTSAWMGRMA